MQSVLPYTVGGSSSTEDCDLRLHKEIFLRNLNRGTHVMITISDFIAVISLCVAFYSLGYSHGKSSKIQK